KRRTASPVQHAHGEPRVLADVLEPWPDPHIPGAILQHAHVAELSSSPDASLVSRGACLSLLLLAHGQMERHLILQILLEPRTPDECAQPKAKAMQPLGHQGPPSECFQHAIDGAAR